MENFREKREEYGKKYNEKLAETGIFWAFGNEQFESNRTHKDKGGKYFSIGFGGYFHEQDKEKVDKFFKEIAPALKADFKKKIDIKDMIEYELENHECYYTGDYEEVVDLVGSYYEEMERADILELVKEIYKKGAY